MQQEDLATLFSRNLILDSSSAPPPEDVNIQEPQNRPQSITYISQHYHHSAHLTSKPQKSDIDRLLSDNNIDPLVLSPPQVELFTNADGSQRNRLMELWRISPPNNETSEFFRGDGIWRDTSIAEEEQMAQMRYESFTRGDSINVQDDSAAVQAVSDRLMEHTAPDLGRDAEPYVLSGYEMLARQEYEEKERSLKESSRYNQATDPVFKGAPGLWEKPAVQDMENQYGAFEQMREYGLWQAPVNNTVEVYNTDDDMVL